MIDLDHFKQVNDGHGHAAGDAMLQAIAEILNHCVRETDAVGRMGGDEFAVLMPGASRKIAAKRADELDRNLNRLTIDWEGTTIPIGASIGLTHFHGGDDEHSVLKNADEAMYRKKFKHNSSLEYR